MRKNDNREDAKGISKLVANSARNQLVQVSASIQSNIKKMPIFKIKDLLQKTDSIPETQNLKLKSKRRSLVNTGEKPSDIEISDFLLYFKKTSRKLMEKAYDRVKFDQILLPDNDKVGIESPQDLPFE